MTSRNRSIPYNQNGNGVKQSPLPSERQSLTQALASDEHHDTSAAPKDDAQEKPSIDDLRRFVFGITSRPPASAPPPACLPLAMADLREPQLVRNDYPLIIGPHSCRSLSDLLHSQFQKAFPADNEARMLKDNLRRLEGMISAAAANNSAPTTLATLFTEVFPAFADEVAPEASHRLQLEEHYQLLGQEIAREDAASLEQVPLAHCIRPEVIPELLKHGCNTMLKPAREAYQQQIRSLAGKLQSLIEIEQSKGPEADSPTFIQSELGQEASRFNTQALSQRLKSAGGSTPISDSAFKQLVSTTALLDSCDVHALPLIVQVASSRVGIDDPSSTIDDQPCQRAITLFDDYATQLTKIVKAVRIAKLILAGQYDAKRLAPFLEAFDWTSFTEEEAQILPCLIAIDSDSALAEEGLTTLSKLLRSGRPIRVVALTEPTACGGDHETRFELGYFGLSHREAFVQQSSLARPHHLLEGWKQATCRMRPSLHLFSVGILSDGRTPSFGAWLHASAAIEGRAHPLFVYDPGAGHTWASRYQLDGNPAVAEDWASYEHESQSQRFTFADFALCDPAFADDFACVTQTLNRDQLISVADYLAQDSDDLDQLPALIAVDAQGKEQQLVVSGRLLNQCRDRASYWQTLREFAGVNNDHVIRAAKSAREQAQAVAAEQQSLLNDQHAEELQQVESEAASKAMQRLAAVLLDLDTANLPAAPRATQPSTPQPPEQAASEDTTSKAATAAESEAEVALVEEAWIDSALCTSCNDCTNLNPQMFVYNDDKQAIIGDITAGSFETLVEAAEVCPSSCIHPGMPIDPNEANLDALIERAQPFQ